MQKLDLLQFEVMDFFGRHIQFLGQKRQKRRVVIFLDARGNSRLLGYIVSVELICDLAENRNELRLLVKLKIVVNAPVDLNTREPRCRRKYTKNHARWMAKVGIRSNGRSILMSLDANESFFSAVTILPARLKSRSNHVCQIPPP